MEYSRSRLPCSWSRSPSRRPAAARRWPGSCSTRCPTTSAHHQLRGGRLDLVWAPRNLQIHSPLRRPTDRAQLCIPAPDRVPPLSHRRAWPQPAGAVGGGHLRGDACGEQPVLCRDLVARQSSKAARQARCSTRDRAAALLSDPGRRRRVSAVDSRRFVAPRGSRDHLVSAAAGDLRALAGSSSFETTESRLTADRPRRLRHANRMRRTTRTPSRSETAASENTNR